MLQNTGLPGITNARERAMIAYALRLTQAPADMTAADLEPLRAAGLSDAEILDANQVTAYFAYANRVVDGLGVQLEPRHRDTRPSHRRPGLAQQFGSIDIYLFDQILRGRIAPGMRVLDAGCGGGRNLMYLLRSGYEIFGADESAAGIAAVRELAASLAPQLPSANFRAEAVESMTFPQHSVDVVISNAVLHFSRDDAHFRAMLRRMWDILAPGGLFFCRLASNIGMENRVRHLQGRRFLLPDSSERYLVDEAMLLAAAREFGADQLDPLKTTIVQDQRCMTTWVLRKRTTSV